MLDKVVAQTNGNSVLNSFPFDVEALAVQKVSAKQAAYYVKSGWLVRLGHGVNAYPSDTLDAPSCILLLQRNSPGLHVGGKSALDLHGVRHNLALRRNWDSLRRAKVPSAREVRGLPRITNGGNLIFKSRFGIWAWKSLLSASNSRPTLRRAESDFLSVLSVSHEIRVLMAVWRRAETE